MGERTRVIFVSGPGYKRWPEALQKVIATVAVMYRSLETTICGGDMPIDEFMRPHRIDYPRLLAELSKTLSSMPLLEPLELTIDDCTLREHNAYMRSFQPWNEQQQPNEPPRALLRMVMWTMRITGDGLCVRKERQSKFRKMNISIYVRCCLNPSMQRGLRNCRRRSGLDKDLRNCYISSL